jgi:hypothetical protein
MFPLLILEGSMWEYVSFIDLGGLNYRACNRREYKLGVLQKCVLVHVLVFMRLESP